MGKSSAFNHLALMASIFDLNLLRSMAKEKMVKLSSFRIFRFDKRPKGRRRRALGTLGLLCLLSALWFRAVNAFVVLSSHQEKSDTEYIYEYNVFLTINSGGAQFGGQQRTSTLKISSLVTISPVWSSKHIIINRFKVTKTKSKFSQDGEKSKIDHKDLVNKIPESDFYVVFDHCHLDVIYMKDGDDLTVDFARGLASMFQFRTKSWKGTEVDINGNCTVHYKVDHHGVTKVKSKCNSVPESPGIQGTSIGWSHRGLYHLQEGDSGFTCSKTKEIIDRCEVVQELHHFVNLVPQVGSVITSKQTLQLKEQLDFEGKWTSKDIKSAINHLQKVLKLEKKPIERGSSYGSGSNPKTNGKELKSLFKKHKRNLKPASLATIKSAVSFKKLVKAISGSTQLTRDDLRNLLNSHIKEHGLEIMDIFGSSKNVQGHQVALETFENLAMSDLSERYLWAVAQLQDCPTEVAKDILAVVDSGDIKGKLKETLILTIGSLARNTAPAMSVNIINWLIDHMTQCKGEDCVVLFVRAMRNTQSRTLAPALLDLAKGDENKVISVEAMKALYSLPLEESEKAVGANKFADEMMHLFANNKKDSSVRGMAAELIARGKASSNQIKTILVTLGEEKKEFRTFLLKRLIDLTHYNRHLKNVLRKMIEKHILNWNLLATGAVSESFSRVLAQTEAGNFSFSFDLEIAGIMLKRSNTEFFLSSPKSCEQSNCDISGFFQLDTFGGGMQQYLGSEGLDEDEVDKSEPHAGMQITVNNNLMRPFVFFTSSSELMALYWSGAAQEKTSAIQMNLVVQDTNEVLLTSSGLAVRFKSFGAMSIDSSGSASISLWTKEAETKVENTGAYHLDYQCTLLAPLKVKHGEVFGGEAVLEIDTDLNWSDGNNICIRVQMPSSHLKYKRIQSGRPSVTRVVKHQGKTVFLTDAINKLCSKMNSSP